MKKKESIDSGIPIKDMEEFFQKRGQRKSEGRYEGLGWKVELKKEKSYEYKNLPIPRSTVFFVGESSAVEKLVAEYRKAFLKAGG